MRIAISFSDKEKATINKVAFTVNPELKNKYNDFFSEEVWAQACPEIDQVEVANRDGVLVFDVHETVMSAAIEILGKCLEAAKIFISPLTNVVGKFSSEVTSIITHKNRLIKKATNFMDEAGDDCLAVYACIDMKGTWYFHQLVEGGNTSKLLEHVDSSKEQIIVLKGGIAFDDIDTIRNLLVVKNDEEI